MPGFEREACPLNLAPTSSATAMLVLGDALAMVLLQARGVGSDDFAAHHPGGSLGKALFTRTADIMRSGESFASVSPDATIEDALEAMGAARCGAVAVVDPETRLLGIFTHGDFARAFQREESIRGRAVSQFMTPDPVTIEGDRLAAEALAALSENRIDDLVVIDSDGRALGIVDSQDLSRLGIV